MKVTARTIALTPLKVARGVTDIVLIAAIVGFLVLFGLQVQHSPKVDEFWVIVQLRKYGDRLVAGVGSWLKLTWPPQTDSWSFLPLGVALLTWVIKIAMDAVFNRGHRMLAKLLPAAKPAGASALGSEGVPSSEPDAPFAESEYARRKRYEEAVEKDLESEVRKRLTFLSVDVVGSTHMKVGEQDDEIIETFQAYKEMVQAIFAHYGAWKQAWTPDGVMVCFLNPQPAVAAAQRILQSLKKFNKTDNKLRTAFSVRCGLNEGEVVIRWHDKLEKVVDHAIDVAGHMQKYGTPDTLWVPAEIYASLANKMGFQPLEAVIDGYRVYEWKPSTP